MTKLQDSPTKLTLGILDCDQLAPELLPNYKNYFNMFRNLLSPYCDGVVLKRYNVLAEEFPSTPDECSAYLITGSKTGVYDDEAWLLPLREFIQSAYKADAKLIGICFGHQILADSLGGKAEKSTKGWGLGALETVLASPSPISDLNSITLLYSHQDQVTQLPPDAHTITSSEFCPIAGFMIPDKVLTFQGHPEFTPAYSQALMNLRKSRYTGNQFEDAINTLNKPLDNQRIAKCLIDFILE